MTRRYDITDVFDRVDPKRYSWLKDNLKEDQYKIVDDGFLISSYNLYFTDPIAETFYLLVWNNG
jgi:hypothetical protein